MLKSCRERLAADANLSLYTSSLAADDLDDIRAALGYPKIVLDGDSYGTFFYLVYMRQHPEHVESAILDGVAPPGLLIIPLQDAAGAQLAVDQLFAACAKDADCAQHFPNVAGPFCRAGTSIRRPDFPMVKAIKACSKTEHAQLLEAFARRDLKEALKATLGHLDHVEAVVLQALGSEAATRTSVQEK